MAQPEGQSCMTCRFYLKDPQEALGLCRRLPPTAFLTTINMPNGQPLPKIMSGWPELLPDRWCGEWKTLAAGAGVVSAVPLATQEAGS